MLNHLAHSLTYFGSTGSFDIIGFITGLGIIAILFVIFAESGLLIGFFFPGDSLLFTAGVLVESGVLDVNIHLFAMLLVIAAVLGYNTGYLFGRKIGPKLFTRPDSRLFKQENVVKARDFYESHGPSAIILTRFMPIVRTFAPIIAGVSKMDYRKFMINNVIGALIWAAGVTYAGYFLGVVFKRAGMDIDTVLLPIIIVILLTSMIPPAYHLLKNKKNRDAFVSTAKRQLNQIFKKK